VSACTSGQLPYSMWAGETFAGSTLQEVCQAAGARNAQMGGSGYFALTGTSCDVGWSGNHYTIQTVCDAASASPAAPAQAATPSTAISCTTACTVTVVHELSLPPLQLDTAGGASIASAVLAVWALGWGIRQVIRVLKSDGDSTSESDL
jgi:hypothetical protein